MPNHAAAMRMTSLFFLPAFCLLIFAGVVSAGEPGSAAGEAIAGDSLTTILRRNSPVLRDVYARNLIQRLYQHNEIGRGDVFRRESKHLSVGD